MDCGLGDIMNVKFPDFDHCTVSMQENVQGTQTGVDRGKGTLYLRFTLK